MIVIWTPEAEQDRADIWDYITADNPVAAVKMDNHFSESAIRLEEQPVMGVPGKIPGTRELFPHHHYRMVYEISEDENTVWILSLVSTFSEWPPV
ncbi:MULTISPECIES: type II toxin-antitoxin system RelE/ParE family toxin [unclassified Brenneria]|uniref:type II toxin-antitoxin system RelE/ParE family toxin n=1 Tax=unclassified Brenneria TaxID=2634434 RepID=UPI0029C2D417|nr:MULTISPECIES: type II toxin-antitoxin system RelE/ParE family toxin [unclassified Brenneria]MDX5627807.1 type II toxin-antitoxin system RelE/ParE family toxin [Brenneria sp. L3-3Z]MDX5695102.1 type II toxin-antitoxin system RelE/ParE family toxin [Brenneria sp. L4-2C]